MALVSLFLSIWSFLLGGLAVAAGIVKAIDAADDSRGFSLFIVGVVAGYALLFHSGGDLGHHRDVRCLPHPLCANQRAAR